MNFGLGCTLALGELRNSAEEIPGWLTQGGVGTRATRPDLPWAIGLSPFRAASGRFGVLLRHGILAINPLT